MITKEDIQTVEDIKKILEPLTEIGETGVDWEKVGMIDTLNKLVENLKIAPKSYKHVPEDENRYYTCICSECGWYGSSELLRGGYQIADTGDYDDSYCPVCNSKEIEDKDNDDYILLPSKLTAENDYKSLLIGEFNESYEGVDEDGNEYIDKIPIEWTTIKEIYNKIVEHEHSKIFKT